MSTIFSDGPLMDGQKLDRLLLAVSGGMDSICLAHYFIKNQKELGLKWLGIVHVHHGLREKTADRDADFVQQFAQNLGIPFFLKKLDGSSLKKLPGSLEENARDARYKTISEVAYTHQVQAIATAHHADDQAETLYLRLRRGVSLAGLGGISPLRAIDDSSTEEKESRRQPLFLYRPFLRFTRKELLEYAFQNHLQWMEDESNHDFKFARNEIRHRRLPYLEQLSPGCSAQLGRLALIAQEAFLKIAKAADHFFAPMILPTEAWPFDSRLAPYAKVLALDANLLEKSLAKETGMAELFRLWLLQKGFRLPLQSKGATLSAPLAREQRLKNLVFEKCRHILWIYDLNTIKNYDNLYLVSGKFFVKGQENRYMQNGDILWPLDEKIRPRKLELWLHQRGIPRWMYRHLPLIAQGSRILFVEGCLLLQNEHFKERS